MIDFSKFKTTKEEIQKIQAIIRRALTINHEINVMNLSMDLECVHNDVGLDLDAMLTGSDMDLMHDINGIMANLDRTTGKLGNCFHPRFAVREKEDFSGFTVFQTGRHYGPNGQRIVWQRRPSGAVYFFDFDRNIDGAFDWDALRPVDDVIVLRMYDKNLYSPCPTWEFINKAKRFIAEQATD